MARRSRPRARQRRLIASGQGGDLRDQIKTWYSVKNFVDQPDTAAIYLYGEIGYWGIEAQDFVRDLMGLRVSNIILHVNSPGGEVFEGLAIYHALRDHPAHVESRVDGLAASAASFIAMAGDVVVMQRNATMMIHDASGIEIGNADEMRSYADLLDKCSDNIADIYVQQGGGTVEQWRTAMKAETWYSAAEALAAGLCDEVNNADETTEEEAAVVPGEDDPEALMDKSWDLSVFTYAGRDKAPAPKPLNELAPEAPAEQPADSVEPETPVVPEQRTDEDNEPEPPAATSEPAATEPEAPAEPAVTDLCAALISGLIEPAPSNVDELFAALQKGIPA